jgi:hypothetical protein
VSAKMKTWLAVRGVGLGMPSLDAMNLRPDAVVDKAESRFESPEPSREARGLDDVLTSA